MPRLSVVIPCFNSAAHLGEALESLAAQSRLPDEVIIADDGSTDDATIQLLEELSRSGSAERVGSESLSRRGLPITVLREPHRGPGPTRNAAVRGSTGELILPLDADDALEEGALESLEAALVADGRADFAFPHVACFGTVHGVAVPPRYNPWLQTQDNTLVVTALLRRSIFEAGAWYADEEGYEDWSFWLAVVERGLRGICVEQPLFRYRRKAGEGQLALDHGRREQLKAALRARHAALYAPEAQARLKARWAPAIEIVASADAGEAVAVFLGRQTFADVRVRPAAEAADAPTILHEARGKWLLLATAAARPLLSSAPSSFLADVMAILDTRPDLEVVTIDGALSLVRTERAARLRHDHLPEGAPAEALAQAVGRGGRVAALRRDLTEGPPGAPPETSRSKAVLSAAASAALPIWKRARGAAEGVLGQARIGRLLHPWKERLADARSRLDGVEAAVRDGRLPVHGGPILSPSERVERKLVDDLG